MPVHTWKSPAPLIYVRPAYISATYTTKGISDLTTATLPSNVKVLPDHLAKISRTLCEIIVSTMPLDEDREDYETRSMRDGLALLPMLYQDMLDEIDGDAGDAMEAVITALCHAGPAELKPDVVSQAFFQQSQRMEQRPRVTQDSATKCHGGQVSL